MWIQQINFHFLQQDIRVDQHFSMWNHHDQSNLLWKSVESLIFVGFKFSLISWVLITHEISVQQIMKLNTVFIHYTKKQIHKIKSHWSKVKKLTIHENWSTQIMMIQQYSLSVWVDIAKHSIAFRYILLCKYSILTKGKGY